MRKEETTLRDDEQVIFTKFITTRNGKRIYASAYGLQAFKLKVRRK